MTAEPSPRPRHVLITADAVGGVWTYATTLARGLGELGVRATIVVLGPAPSAGQRAAVGDVAVVEAGGALDWLAGTEAEVRAAARALRRCVGALRPDLLHLNSPALAAFGPLGAPVVAGCHSCLATWWDAVRGGPPPEDFAWPSRLVRRGLGAAAAVVAPSAAFAATIARRHGLAVLPSVVWNGAPVRDATADMDAPAALAFTAGRLWDDAKDIATLDRAAARITAPVVAAGPLRGPNGAEARPQAIRCLGPLDPEAMADWLARRPVFVSTARYEPFGLAVLEAAQAGCALVLSDIPTFRELWSDAAWFAPAGDAPAFARAIDRLLHEPATRSVLGALARTRAARFTPEAMCVGTLAVHRQVLAHQTRSTAA